MNGKRAIPFGYEIRDGRVAVNPAEAEAVGRIYELYLSGAGYKTIAARMGASVVAYRGGAAWNQHMVKRILEDRRYTGADGYPAIISGGVFERVAGRKNANPFCKSPKRRPPAEAEPVGLVPVYIPTQAVRRRTHDINRALEKNAGDTEHIRSLIFACTAEKYSSLRGAELHG